jgi:hypothetical protein
MPGKVKLDNGLQAMTMEWTAAGYQPTACASSAPHPSTA